MADYYAQVFGQFANGRGWSTGRHISSVQSEPGLLATWEAAWTAEWTDGVHGMEAAYPIGTKITGFTVASLNPDFTEHSKSRAGVSLPGTDPGVSMPTQVSVVVAWKNSARIGRHAQSHQGLPAPSDGAAAGDILTDPIITRFKLAMMGMKASIEADGSLFFSVNRVALKNGTPAGDKVTMNQLFIRNKVGTMDPRARGELSVYT